MSKFKLLINILLIASLCSCDPGTGDVYFIDNRSDFDVFVGYIDWEHDTVVSVEPQNHILLYEHYYIGQAKDHKDDFLNNFDTIFVGVNDTIICTKDILLRENWDFKITGGDDGWGDGGTSEYTFTINNDDLILSTPY